MSYEYGYQVHAFAPPSAYILRIDRDRSLNLKSGTIQVIGRGLPDRTFPEEARQLASAQKAAYDDAAMRLKETLESLNYLIEEGKAPISVIRAMQMDASLANRVQDVLKNQRVVYSRKRPWFWETMLELNVSRNPLLFGKLEIFRMARPSVVIDRPTAVTIGAPFPEFHLRDIFSDKPHSLTSIGGKVNLFLLWRPEDYHSVVALQGVDSFYRSFRGKGLQVVGIVAGGDKALAYKVVAQRKIGFPNLYDPDARLARMLGASAIPVYVSVLRTPNSITYYSVGSPVFNLQPKAALYRMIMANLQGLHFPP